VLDDLELNQHAYKMDGVVLAWLIEPTEDYWPKIYLGERIANQ